MSVDIQGLEQRSLGEREAATLAQLATLEEELRALRLATSAAHHHHHCEGGNGGTSATQGECCWDVCVA